MTTKTMLLWLTVLLAAPVQDAFAFYNPSEGRWLSRDPVHEVGTAPWRLRATAAARTAALDASDTEHTEAALGYDEGLNLYLFVRNSAPLSVDAVGTGIICSCTFFPLPLLMPLPPCGPHSGAAIGTIITRGPWTGSCVNTKTGLRGRCGCVVAIPCIYQYTATCTASATGPFWFFSPLTQVSGWCLP